MPDFEQGSEHVAGLKPHHEPWGTQDFALCTTWSPLVLPSRAARNSEISLAVTQHRAGPWFGGPAIHVVNP